MAKRRGTHGRMRDSVNGHHDHFESLEDEENPEAESGDCGDVRSSASSAKVEFTNNSDEDWKTPNLGP